MQKSHNKIDKHTSFSDGHFSGFYGRMRGKSGGERVFFRPAAAGKVPLYKGGCQLADWGIVRDRKRTTPPVLRTTSPYTGEAKGQGLPPFSSVFARRPLQHGRHIWRPYGVHQKYRLKHCRAAIYRGRPPSRPQAKFKCAAGAPYLFTIHYSLFTIHDSLTSPSISLT